MTNLISNNSKLESLILRELKLYEQERSLIHMNDNSEVLLNENIINRLIPALRKRTFKDILPGGVAKYTRRLQNLINVAKEYKIMSHIFPDLNPKTLRTLFRRYKFGPKFNQDMERIFMARMNYLNFLSGLPKQAAGAINNLLKLATKEGINPSVIQKLISYDRKRLQTWHQGAIDQLSNDIASTKELINKFRSMSISRKFSDYFDLDKTKVTRRGAGPRDMKDRRRELRGRTSTTTGDPRAGEKLLRDVIPDKVLDKMLAGLKQHVKEMEVVRKNLQKQQDNLASASDEVFLKYLYNVAKETGENLIGPTGVRYTATLKRAFSKDQPIGRLLAKLKDISRKEKKALEKEISDAAAEKAAKRGAPKSPKKGMITVGGAVRGAFKYVGIGAVVSTLAANLGPVSPQWRQQLERYVSDEAVGRYTKSLMELLMNLGVSRETAEKWATTWIPRIISVLIGNESRRLIQGAANAVKRVYKGEGLLPQDYLNSLLSGEFKGVKVNRFRMPVEDEYEISERWEIFFSNWYGAWAIQGMNEGERFNGSKVEQDLDEALTKLVRDFQGVVGAKRLSGAAFGGGAKGVREASEVFSPKQIEKFFKNQFKRMGERGFFEKEIEQKAKNFFKDLGTQDPDTVERITTDIQAAQYMSLYNRIYVPLLSGKSNFVNYKLRDFAFPSDEKRKNPAKAAKALEEANVARQKYLILINSILMPLNPTKKEYKAMYLPTEEKDYKDLGVPYPTNWGDTTVIKRMSDVYKNKNVLSGAMSAYEIKEEDDAKKLMKFTYFLIDAYYVYGGIEKEEGESEKSYRNRETRFSNFKKKHEKSVLEAMKDVTKDMQGDILTDFFTKVFQSDFFPVTEEIKNIFLNKLQEYYDKAGF